MFRDNATFIVFALFLISFCDTTSLKCTQLTTCSCMFSNGEGYDLSNLTDIGLLEAKEPSQNYKFYFHPCNNTLMKVNKDGNECNSGKGVSLCAQSLTTSKETFSLGTAEETKMVIENITPVLILTHGQFTSKIDLVCCSEATCVTNLRSYIQEPNSTQFHMELQSPAACMKLLKSRSLSTGSVLVILLFVFSGLYFIGGAVILKLLRGATGWEMLPNHEFWCELPSLVRDGIAFTFNRCRVDSYERI